MNLDLLSHDELLDLHESLSELKIRNGRRSIDSYYQLDGNSRRELYPKHMEHFKSGHDYKMRLFMAANRIGKTFAAAYELTCHITGEYPSWWEGKRFKNCQEWWVCGKDTKTVNEILQVTLLGPVGAFGTGMIPYDSIDHSSIKDAKKADTNISQFRVKHKSGSLSTVSFKTYESGRQSFEGTARSIWLDEEPPLSVFTECLLRTATGDNCLMMTFTPLKGISETIVNFLDGTSFQAGPVGKGKYVTMATWDDVPHLSEEDKEILLASIPPYQRDARTKGIPQLGAGAIYPVPESEYLIKPFEIPDHWRRVFGMDVGWNKTAVVWAAIDPDTNIIYLYSEYYKGEAEPSIHAVGIRSRGDWIPGVVDTAARGRSQIDGEQLMKMYRDLGLKLSDADKSVETGLYTCWELLSTGQLRVFNSLTNFLDEIRIYRRDEKGKVVKSHDHLMDAFRYLIMSGRNIARVKAPIQRKKSSGLPSTTAWA